MFDILFVVILLLNILGILNGWWGKGRIEAFLAVVPDIATPHELNQFKRMVKEQMYLALGQLLLLGGALVLMIYGILAERLGFLDILILILVNGFIFFMARRFKRVEQQAASLPVTDQALTDEYQRVCLTWRRKPFPDW